MNLSRDLSGAGSRLQAHASEWAGAWWDYLDRFHTERPGITEQVLLRSTSGDQSPYRWLARAVAGRADVVVDVGCGSGAMGRELAQDGRTVVSVDLSEAELQGARQRGGGPFVRADARRLPFADASVDAVVSSLGLAVIHPRKQWLDEAARVLRPGGVLACLTPTVRPLAPADARVGTRLIGRLRMAPVFPVGIELASGPVLAESGLRRIEDNRERYRFPVRSREDAELLLSALYLPGVGPGRVRAASDWLARGAERDGEVLVPVPMRRIVAMKSVTRH